MVFVEQALSSPPTNGGTISMSAEKHLVGVVRVNLVNFSTCLHRLARAGCCQCNLASGMTTTTMAAGWSGAKEGQGTAGPVICAACVPAAEMACWQDPGMSVLEGSNVMANWATDIDSVGGGAGMVHTWVGQKL